LPVCTACVNPAISGPVLCPKSASPVQSRAPEITRRIYPRGAPSTPIQVVAL
jgi:hypothetical protein